VDLYIHSPKRLHGAVLNSLSAGTTLPFIMQQEGMLELNFPSHLIYVLMKVCSRLFMHL
jgi:hypothetical protein